MSHSSTSNSDPLSPSRDSGQPPTADRPWVPRAALGTVVLVLVINLIAGFFIAKTDWLPSEPRVLVTKQLAELREGDDLWLLGSSTLAQGIEPERLATQTGLDVSVFTLGSAGPVSLTEMAIAGLEGDSTPPRAVYLFVFKDTLNVNRPTIADDRRYVAALNDPTVAERVTSIAPVYNYRDSIKFNIRRSMATALSPGRSRSAPPPPPDQAKPIDDADMTKLMVSGADFQIDMGRLEELAELCQNEGVSLYLVITPTTEAAVNWQNKYVPDLPYDAMVQQIRADGPTQGYRVIDYTGLFPSTTHYFRDPYHIREQYMASFTDTFAQAVQEHLNEPTGSE